MQKRRFFELVGYDKSDFIDYLAVLLCMANNKAGIQIVRIDID